MMQETPSETTVVWERFTSQILASNPLGDPVTRRLPVVLPPGYDPSRRYPVLYGLVGFTGRGTMMLNDLAWDINFQDRLERLYTEGMPHAIVVLPDCFTRFGGSQYLNSSATGRYEDYLIDEIVPYIDRRYATIAVAEGRAVFGHSSGGFGALSLGMRHPNIFGALACHSGDMAFDLCYGVDFPKAATAIAQAGGVEAWWQAFDARRKKDGADFTTLNIIAMAACYSPEPSAPLGLALPFDLETCTLNEQIWERWCSHDPIELVERYAEALRSLRLLFFDCGTRDEFHLHFGARRLAGRLKELEIPHIYEEFDDSHRGIQYRYDVSLPKLVEALAQH